MHRFSQKGVQRRNQLQEKRVGRRAAGTAAVEDIIDSLETVSVIRMTNFFLDKGVNNKLKAKVMCIVVCKRGSTGNWAVVDCHNHTPSKYILLDESLSLGEIVFIYQLCSFFDVTVVYMPYYGVQSCCRHFIGGTSPPKRVCSTSMELLVKNTLTIMRKYLFHIVFIVTQSHNVVALLLSCPNFGRSLLLLSRGDQIFNLQHMEDSEETPSEIEQQYYTLFGRAINDPLHFVGRGHSLNSYTCKSTACSPRLIASSSSINTPYKQLHSGQLLVKSPTIMDILDQDLVCRT